MENIRSESVKGTTWSLIDNICSQGFLFFTGIVLARLLSPSDYGAIGVLTIFLLIANVFVDCGFGNALIRKKNRTEEDLSTAFYFNFIVGLVAYFVLFFAAPLIAWFFRIAILTDLLRVLALCVVFNSLSIVQNSILTANLKIKKQAIINISTQIPMGCLGIYLAFNGWGVWTLVAQQVGASFLKMLLLWIYSRWTPSVLFNKKSFSYLYNFGWKLLCSNLLGTFFNEIYGFVIGRYLGSSDLGFYTKGKQLAEYPKRLIANVINRVVLPIMVYTQGDNLDHVRDVYRRMIGLLCFVTFPVFVSLIIIAKPLILLLWSDKWANSILLFQLFCVGFALAPISSLNFSLLQLLNRTDITLKIEFIKKPICLIFLVISIPFGLKGIVLFSTLYNIVGTMINMYPTKALINYSIVNQCKDILIYFGISIITAVVAYLATSLIDNLFVKLILGLIISFFSFFLLNYLGKTPGYYGIIKLLWHRK